MSISFDRETLKASRRIQPASPGHEAQARTSPLSEPKAGAPVVEGWVRLATDSKARVGGVLCAVKKQRKTSDRLVVVTRAEVTKTDCQDVPADRSEGDDAELAVVMMLGLEFSRNTSQNT